MKQLKQSDFTKVRHLYAENTPNYAVVMAIIEGNNPGKIWVDNISKPLQSLVISAGSYSFISGCESEQFKHDVTKILQSNKPIKLIHEVKNKPLLSIDSFERINRIQFYYPKNAFDKCKIFISQIPTDFEVSRFDKNMIKKSNWYHYLLQFYGTIENYIKYGFGFCLVKDGHVISEAHACYVGGGMVETGSVTHEHYQNRNLATIIRAHLIQECFIRNLIPISSCDEANLASASVSKKLGFEEQFRYQFLRLL